MGVLGRLLGRKLPPAPAEAREMVFPTGIRSSLGGRRANTVAAENLSSVLGAVELIANSIASLPASIVTDGPNGREPAPNVPGARLIARPNARQSWPAYMTTVVASVLLHGNSVSMVTTNARGEVTAVTPVPWPWIGPIIVEGAAGPRLAFDVMANTAEARLLGLPRRLFADECLHIMARSDDGIIGRSVLSRAPGALGAAIGVQEFARTIWENGANIPGILGLPVSVTTDGKNRAEAFFADRHSGASNAGKPFLSDAGTTWTPVGMTATDAEVLASRRFSVGDIARLFCIPEPMLQTGASAPSSLTPFMAAFCQLALAPIVAAIEAEFDDLVPRGQHLQIDMAGMQRGDWTAVAAAQAVLVQSGVATPNDARRSVGLPAHTDGDALRVGGPPSYPPDATGSPSLAPKPGPGGNLPNVGTNQNEGSGGG